MNQKTISLTEGSLRKNILLFSLPLMCTNLLQLHEQFMDTFSGYSPLDWVERA